MATITISIPDERYAELRAIAARHAIKPEDLLRVSLEELLKRSERDFETALARVATKNTELYKRLA